MNKSVFLSAALAAALGLSACSASGAPGQAGQPGQGASTQSVPGGTPSGQSSPTATASSPEASAAATAPSASAAPSSMTPTPTPSPTPDGSAGLASFTFPDGHLTFSYPANWTVRVEKTAPSANQPPGVDPVQAVLADQTGNELLAITSNAYGGGVSGPVLRTAR